jgi:hypothetical protein
LPSSCWLQALHAGERKWIDAELVATPGYLQWHAEDLLDKALRKKALVP